MTVPYDAPAMSGVAQCPCCGDDTMVRDWRSPELCDLCYGGECSPDGAGECMRLDGYPSDSYGATQDARPQYDGWTPADFED